MRTRVDDKFREEAQSFRLQFGCEACAHFCLETKCCSGGFPVEPHLRIELRQVDALEFCKQFELA